MRLRLVLVTLLHVSLSAQSPIHSSFAQETDKAPSPDIEAASPPSEPAQAPTPADERRLPEFLLHEREDAVIVLGELRGAVRTSPDSAEDRLKLAQGLSRVGDLDAALDECRVALKLAPGNARAHLQLGITLMAKQDARGAATALTEATLLDPALTHAHYSLGSVQYALGNLTAAIRSYRRALELQPDFPDARYRLALVLKLTNQHQEAAEFMEEAAVGGIPQAQYFLGNAYRSGQGVDKNPAAAIRWWTQAVAFGHQRAADSLSQLRRQALSPDQPDRRRKEALAAFTQYRDLLWTEYPDLTRNDPNESLGAALLMNSQAADGVTVLLSEAAALSEPALGELARLYESGLEPRLAQFDKRILTTLETLAADGFIPAKRALARIYGTGLGVTPDLQKAKMALKGLSKRESKAVLDEFTLR